jgi:iron(III) transport system permease protein
MLDTSVGWFHLSQGAESVAQVLDAYHLPGLLLFLGVSLALVPRRWIAWHEQEQQNRSSARQLDQAMLAGARPGRARRLAFRYARRIPVRRVVLWGALAATNLTPAILLTPTVESRPLGPGVLILADQPGDFRSQAAALALVAVALNVTALGWASAGPGSHARPLDTRELV